VPRAFCQQLRCSLPILSFLLSCYDNFKPGRDTTIFHSSLFKVPDATRRSFLISSFSFFTAAAFVSSGKGLRRFCS
jgi:hypothetical protein